MAKRINWVKIKTEYITNPDTSFSILSKKYKVSEQSLTKHSVAENWVAEREKSLTEIQGKLTEQVQMDIASYQARKFQDGMRMVDKALPALEQAERISPLTAATTIQIGHKMATEALGLDNAKVAEQHLTINNTNIFSLGDFVKALKDKIAAQHG